MFPHKFTSYLWVVVLTIFGLVLSGVTPVMAQEQVNATVRDMDDSTQKAKNFVMAWHTDQENADALVKQLGGTNLSIRRVTKEEADNYQKPDVTVTDEVMSVDKLTTGLAKLQGQSTDRGALHNPDCIVFVDITIIDWGNGTVMILVNVTFVGYCPGVWVIIWFLLE